MRRLRAAVMVASFFCLAASPALAFSGATPPPSRLSNGVEVLSGGVGEVEREVLGRTADGYDLKAIFALEQGAYLSDVNVTIRDSRGDVVVDTIAKGPWLFAKLDPGSYRVTASKLGRTFEEHVTVADARQTTVRFNDWTERDTGPIYPPTVR